MSQAAFIIYYLRPRFNIPLFYTLAKGLMTIKVVPLLKGDKKSYQCPCDVKLVTGFMLLLAHIFEIISGEKKVQGISQGLKNILVSKKKIFSMLKSMIRIKPE
uniref:Uncharacterized protein n=1 Tax=Cacopsylla melanoneura TaxID=428564 RepID=A0A8D9FJS4_9HEMI